MAGWEEHQEIYREVNGLLEFTNEIQKRIKENGLSKETVEGCRETHQEAGLTGSGEAIGQKVMETIEAMAKNLTEGERLSRKSHTAELALTLQPIFADASSIRLHFFHCKLRLSSPFSTEFHFPFSPLPP